MLVCFIVINVTMVNSSSNGLSSQHMTVAFLFLLGRNWLTCGDWIMWVWCNELCSLYVQWWCCCCCCSRDGEQERRRSLYCRMMTSETTSITMMKREVERMIRYLCPKSIKWPTIICGNVLIRGPDSVQTTGVWGWFDPDCPPDNWISNLG